MFERQNLRVTGRPLERSARIEGRGEEIVTGKWINIRLDSERVVADHLQSLRSVMRQMKVP